MLGIGIKRFPSQFFHEKRSKYACECCSHDASSDIYQNMVYTLSELPIPLHSQALHYTLCRHVRYQQPTKCNCNATRFIGFKHLFFFELDQRQLSGLGRVVVFFWFHALFQQHQHPQAKSPKINC